jgi:hypothetical protein
VADRIGEFVAGETRFAGSVADRVRAAVSEVLAAAVVEIHEAERAGLVLTAAQRYRKAAIVRELDELLGLASAPSKELLP